MHQKQPLLIDLKKFKPKIVNSTALKLLSFKVMETKMTLNCRSKNHLIKWKLQGFKSQVMKLQKKLILARDLHP